MSDRKAQGKKWDNSSLFIIFEALCTTQNHI